MLTAWLIVAAPIVALTIHYVREWYFDKQTPAWHLSRLIRRLEKKPHIRS